MCLLQYDTLAAVDWLNATALNSSLEKKPKTHKRRLYIRFDCDGFYGTDSEIKHNGKEYPIFGSIACVTQGKNWKATQTGNCDKFFQISVRQDATQ